MALDVGQADWFSKPGDSISVAMKRRGIGVDTLASCLDGGIGDVRALLDGALPIDAHISSVLSDTLGGSASFWLKRQEKFAAALERAVEAAGSDASEWVERVPMPAAQGRQARRSGRGLLGEIRRRMLFYNVPSLASWENRYGKICSETHFRRSMSFVPRNAAMLLWLRRGELESELVQTRHWSSDNLRDRLDAIRSLTKIGNPSRFLPKLRTLCAEAGVAVVVVRTPQGCHASGATRLVSGDKAMMLLSFRHRADDQFWFTVFHEIGHLLLHSAATFVDGDDTPNDQYELEANRFASDCIVPEQRESELLKLGANRNAIVRFSVSAGVAPGLTVGQMQHRGVIEHRQMNHLKRRWNWDEIEHVTV